MKTLILLASLVLLEVHTSRAVLVLQGPEDPVLEGDDVTLECVFTESEYNISQVHFERFAKFSKMWYQLEPNEGYLYRRCFTYDVDVRREPGRLLLYIASIQSWSEGPYRCVSSNATATDNSSQPLSIAVNYMRELSVYREGVGSYSRYLTSLQDLRVPLGEDVEVACSTTASQAPQYFWRKEGGDWILPTSKLTLRKVSPEDGGRYTCTAEHPSVSTLKKSHTISITVLPEDAAWYESTNGRILLMISATGVGLLVIIVVITVFLIRRSKERKTKGPIDDHSQKKPIYTASSESLPSADGDQQPLV